MEKNNRYDSIDGLRALCAIGIIFMHMAAKGNNRYEMQGVIINKVIPFFTEFVYLFMIISAFSICCGYYKRISEGIITPSQFYEKRYSKILPFFSVLVIFDLLLEHSISAIYEGIANLTLAFGLLPNANISVIGVGWFLGTVFVFYMLFPYFCFLMKNKVRAWLAMLITIVYNYMSLNYFFDEAHVVQDMSKRTNFIYSSMFFMTGCMIFLYKDFLVSFVKKVRWILLIAIIATIVGYFFINTTQFVKNIYFVILFSLMLIYAIGADNSLLNNKFTKFIAGISLEIYLCHMMIFRIVEKLHLNYLFGNGWVSYLFTTLIVICGAIVFSLSFQKIYSYLLKKIND